jgi:hypothetical protein
MLFMISLPYCAFVLTWLPEECCHMVSVLTFASLRASDQSANRHISGHQDLTGRRGLRNFVRDLPLGQLIKELKGNRAIGAACLSLEL